MYMERTGEFVVSTDCDGESSTERCDILPEKPADAEELEAARSAARRRLTATVRERVQKYFDSVFENLS